MRTTARFLGYQTSSARGDPAAPKAMIGESSMLEKEIWTEKDFDVMGWHDATVWAVAFLPDVNEFVLDIDYIVQWISPEEGSGSFRFWVAPATLVFHKIYSLCMDIDIQFQPWQLQIDDLERLEPRVFEDGTDWLWAVGVSGGEISCRASGFHQYFRRRPVLSGPQTLALESRGGISFSRSTPSSSTAGPSLAEDRSRVGGGDGPP